MRLLLILILFCNIAFAKELNVEINSKEAALGSPLELSIETDNLNADVDTANLSTLFYVAGRQQSTYSQYLNGNWSNSKKIILTLIPKQEGNVVIPSIKVGSDYTKPIAIHVVKQVSRVVVEGEVNNPNPYVGSEIIYTLKVHIEPNMQVELYKPNINNKNIKTYSIEQETKKDGTTYVLKYSMFPQVSGDITISPVTVEGSEIENVRAFFFQSLASTKPFVVNSNEVALQVKPKKTNSWYPARTLKAEVVKEVEDKGTKGNPLTRIIKISAEGLGVSDLPEIQVQDTEEFNVFVDKESSNDELSEEGISSFQEYKITYIPKVVENIKIPDIEMSWWNVKTDKEEKLIIAGKEITVQESYLKEVSLPVIEENIVEKSNYWFYVAIASMILNALFIFAYLKQKIKIKLSTKKVNLLAEIKKSCTEKDVKNLARLTILYANNKLGNIHTLSEFANQVDDARLSELLFDLERALYSTSIVNFEFNEFGDMIARYTFNKNESNKTELDLPSLNNL